MNQVKTEDGAVLVYRRRAAAGDAVGRIVLVHALGMDASNWAGVVDELPASIEAVSVDVRGHGRSTAGSLRLSLDVAAQDIRRLMDELGWSKAIVGGCSMGGCIAQAFAVAHPDRLDGLVLVDTTAWYGAQARENWSKRAEKLRIDGFASMTAFQVERWFSPGFANANPDIVEHYVNVFMNNDLATYADACAMLGAVDLRGALRTISAPTAIVVGGEDYATPVAMAEALHDAIKGSSLTVLEGVRHFTPVEAPDRIAEAIVSVPMASRVGAIDDGGRK